MSNLNLETGQIQNMDQNLNVLQSDSSTMQTNTQRPMQSLTNFAHIDQNCVTAAAPQASSASTRGPWVLPVLDLCGNSIVSLNLGSLLLENYPKGSCHVSAALLIAEVKRALHATEREGILHDEVPDDDVDVLDRYQVRKLLFERAASETGDNDEVETVTEQLRESAFTDWLSQVADWDAIQRELVSARVSYDRDPMSNPVWHRRVEFLNRLRKLPGGSDAVLIPDEFLDDKTAVLRTWAKNLEPVCKAGPNLRKVSRRLKRDRDVATFAIRYGVLRNIKYVQNGDAVNNYKYPQLRRELALQFLLPIFKDSKEDGDESVYCDGCDTDIILDAGYNFLPELRDCKKAVGSVIGDNAAAGLDFASPRLKRDREVAIWAVEKDGAQILSMLAQDFRQDAEIVAIAKQRSSELRAAYGPGFVDSDEDM